MVGYAPSRVHSESGEGFLRIKTNAANRMYSYDARTKRMAFLQAGSVESLVPEFKAGMPISLRVGYVDKSVEVYHHYEGERNWTVRVPRDVAAPGEVLSILVEPLSRSQFIRRLPELDLKAEPFQRWLPHETVVDGFCLEGDHACMRAKQVPSVEGISEFCLEMTMSSSLGFNGGRTFVDLVLTDRFGHNRVLRAYHNGHSRMMLALWSGSCFRRAILISHDGSRVSIVTRAGTENSTATIYVSDPANLYSIGEIDKRYDAHRLKGVSELYRIGDVVYRREIEGMMRDSQSAYAHGRVGSELAYAVAKQKLKLGPVTLNEPSRGGKDLASNDGKVAIQARLLTKTKVASDSRRKVQIQIALNSLVRKVRQDFEFNPVLCAGYAILSYLDCTGETRILVARICRDEQSVTCGNTQAEGSKGVNPLRLRPWLRILLDSSSPGRK